MVDYQQILDGKHVKAFAAGEGLPTLVVDDHVDLMSRVGEDLGAAYDDRRARATSAATSALRTTGLTNTPASVSACSS
jgi:hypothetical protein